MWLLINNIHEQISRWLSGRNARVSRNQEKKCAINCAVMGLPLIWKQTIWLVLIRPYCWLANHNPEFRYVICTVLHYLHWCYASLHSCYTFCNPFSANQNRVILSCILLVSLLHFRFSSFTCELLEVAFLFCMVDLLGFVMRQDHCSPRIALANCGPVLISLCICKLLIKLNLHELEITQSK